MNAYGVTAKSMIIMKTKKDNVIDLFGVFGLCFLHGLVFFLMICKVKIKLRIKREMKREQHIR